MKLSPEKLTCSCVSLLMCYTVLEAAILDQQQARNILLDGPSSVFTNRGEDVNTIRQGEAVPSATSANAPTLLPTSPAGLIMDEDTGIAGFLRRAGAKLFGRKQAESKLPLDLDPTNLSLPELFSTLASLPASKFDKIADQLIAETFGIGSVVPAPPGFLGGLGLPALPIKGPGHHDPRQGSASTNIASIAPGLSGMLSQPLHPFSQPSAVFANTLPLSTVVFPVFVPKDQPLPGHRSMNRHNNHNNGSQFLGSPTPSSLDVTQAASHSPLFAFPPPPPSHHQPYSHPHHRLHMDHNDMSSLVPHNLMPGSIAQHGTPSHHFPLESLSNMVHSGFLHDINKLSQHSFPLTGNRNSATRDQVSSPGNMNGERGRQQDRWFADPQPTQGRSDTRSLFLPSSSSSLLSPSPLESTIMESRKASVSPEDVRRGMASHATKGYPILDTSSSTPSIYHAPHNPVDILKIFATAYEAARSVEQSRNPSQSSALIGHSVNHLQRTSSDKEAESTKKIETTITSFPVFMKDDSNATPSGGSGTRGEVAMRPRKFVTYLS